MTARSYWGTLAGLLFLVGSLGADAPSPADFGYGQALTESGRDALLVQLLPNEKGNHEIAVNAKVLADVQGKVKEGATVKIVGGMVPFSGSAEWNLPLMDAPGAIELWPVVEKGPGKYQFRNDQNVFPIGIDCDTRIAPADIDKVKTALKELKTAVDAPGHGGPSRARASELLKENNYYLWALGVWRIAQDTNAKDIKLLENLFYAPDLSPAQAIWLDLVLTSQLRGDEALPHPSDAQMHALVRDYLRGYLTRHPGLPGRVAPAPLPPSPERPAPSTQNAPHQKAGPPEGSVK